MFWIQQKLDLTDNCLIEMHSKGSQNLFEVWIFWKSFELVTSCYLNWALITPKLNESI